MRLELRMETVFKGHTLIKILMVTPNYLSFIEFILINIAK